MPFLLAYPSVSSGSGPTGMALTPDPTSIAPNASAGTFVATISVIGGTAPYTFSASNARFQISGSPGTTAILQVAAGASFTPGGAEDPGISIVDANSLLFSTDYTISIQTVPTDISLSGTTLPDNAASGMVIGTASTIGGVAGYVYTSSNSLFTFDGATLVYNTGTLTPGTVSTTIQTTDANGNTYPGSGKSFNITIQDHTAQNIIQSFYVINRETTATGANFVTPIFGRGFVAGDLPSAQYPAFQLANGTNVPYSYGNKVTWANGASNESWKFASFMLRIPTSIAGRASSKTVTSIAKSNSKNPAKGGVCTLVAHGYNTGDCLLLAGALTRGVTDTGWVYKIDDDNFALYYSPDDAASAAAGTLGLNILKNPSRRMVPKINGGGFTVSKASYLKINILTNGTVPTPSSRSASDWSAGGLDLQLKAVGLGYGDAGYLTGSWYSNLNDGFSGVSDLGARVYVTMDGDAGKSWIVQQAFRQSGSDHGNLTCDWHITATQDASGNLQFLRARPRVIQPWVRQTNACIIGFDSLVLHNGATPIFDPWDLAGKNTVYPFTWLSNQGGDGTGTADFVSPNNHMGDGSNGNAGFLAKLSTTGTLPNGLSPNTLYFFAGGPTIWQNGEALVSATATTAVLSNECSPIDDSYNGIQLSITGTGPAVGSRAIISDYIGSTKTAIIPSSGEGAWTNGVPDTSVPGTAYKYKLTYVGSGASLFNLSRDSGGSISNGHMVTNSSQGVGDHAITLKPFCCYFSGQFISNLDGTRYGLQGAGSLSAEPPVHIQFDREYDIESGLVPPFDLQYGASGFGEYARYIIDAGGLGLQGVGSPGERPDIGVIPDWYVQHFVSQSWADSQNVRVQGLIGSHFSMVLRDKEVDMPIPMLSTARVGPYETTTPPYNMPLTSTANPIAPIPREKLAWDAGAANTVGGPLTNQSGTFNKQNTDHLPAYPGYPFFYDGGTEYMDIVSEFGQNAVATRAATPGVADAKYIGKERNGTVDGVVFEGTCFGATQPRVDAWSLRDVAIAAGMLPDIWPRSPSATTNNYKTYTQQLLNCSFGKALGWINAPFYPAYAKSKGMFTYTPASGRVPMWEEGYTRMAICHAIQLNAGTSAATNGLALIQHWVKWQEHIQSTYGGWCLSIYHSVFRMGPATAGSDGAELPLMNDDNLWFGNQPLEVKWDNSVTPTLFSSNMARENGYVLTNGDVIAFTNNGGNAGIPGGIPQYQILYVINATPTPNDKGNMGTFNITSVQGDSGSILNATNSQLSEFKECNMRCQLAASAVYPDDKMSYLIPSAPQDSAGYFSNAVGTIRWTKHVGATVSSSLLAYCNQAGSYNIPKQTPSEGLKYYFTE